MVACFFEVLVNVYNFYLPYTCKCYTGHDTNQAQGKVKQCYLETIVIDHTVGINLALTEGIDFEPDCLPSTDLLYI